MNLSGEYTLPVPIEQVWQTLLDPDVLNECIPGCQELRPAETGLPDVYDATLSIGVASVRGTYKGTVRVADQEPLVSYRLEVRGGGDKGTSTAAGRLEFISLDGTDKGKTLVRYTGDYQVAGPIASVGQRLFHPVAQLLTGQFFRCVEKRVSLEAAS